MVIQIRMVLDMLTAAQGGTCAVIKVECCICIPDLCGNVSTALDDMKNQVKAMSNENGFGLAHRCSRRDLCYIVKVECCVYIPDLSGNVSAAFNIMKNQVKAMSNENIPFWTSVLSWVEG